MERIVYKTKVRDLSRVPLEKLLRMEDVAAGNLAALERRGQTPAFYEGLVALHQALTLEIALRDAVAPPIEVELVLEEEQTA